MMLIRVVDVVTSGLLLAVSSPVFLAIAILIKLDSPGPVFFLQERVGRGWHRFRMFKFRKMAHGGKSNGPGITARFDPRVTRIGSWL
jgi:lipopolysaccharide/colanic/teichoic acid biosynthesis glycosyltransferase